MDWGHKVNHIYDVSRKYNSRYARSPSKTQGYVANHTITEYKISHPGNGCRNCK